MSDYIPLADQYHQALLRAHGLPVDMTIAHKTSGNNADCHVSHGKTDWKPFPLECLPGVLKRYSSKMAESLNADPVFVLWPALASVAGAIGTSRQIQVNPTFYQYPAVWLGLVAPTGTGKSTSFNAVLRPYREIEDRLEAASQTVGDDEKPADPPRLTVSDCTGEGLLSLLSRNPYGLLAEFDELASLFSGMDRYRSSKRGGSDRAAMLSTYDGSRIRIDRKTGDEKVIKIPRALVSIVGGIQPEILAGLISRDDSESGFLSRFSLCMPPAKVTPLSIDPPRYPADAANAYESLLGMLVAGRETEQVCKLDRSGYARFIEYDAGLADQMNGLPGGPSRGFLAKSRGRCARLACLLHYAEHGPDAPETVELQTVESAIRISSWLDDENLRVYCLLGLGGETTFQDRLLERIRQNRGATPRDLMRWHGARYQSGDQAERELIGLMEAGFLHRKTISPEGRGRPQDKFFCCDT